MIMVYFSIFQLLRATSEQKAVQSEIPEALAEVKAEPKDSSLETPKKPVPKKPAVKKPTAKKPTKEKAASPKKTSKKAA